ncbi:MAG: hypothetical protein JWO79_3048 [Actinomycetia bacterium]|jgi:hypothetical protein|nr:hypothetical protein [Actinomycetes bacterium]
MATGLRDFPVEVTIDGHRHVLLVAATSFAAALGQVELDCLGGRHAAYRTDPAGELVVNWRGALQASVSPAPVRRGEGR